MGIKSTATLCKRKLHRARKTNENDACEADSDDVGDVDPGDGGRSQGFTWIHQKGHRTLCS